MEVIVKKNYEEMSKVAATLFAAEIMENPKTILGMATGSTPVGLYKELVKMYEAGDLDFSQVTTFNLDEYIGLAPEHDQSYHYFMNDNLFNHVNINKENVHVPDGVGFEAGEAGKAYEELMAKTGQVEIQLLGLGCNGHIGFNEPGEAFETETHCVDLQERTIEANKRFFASIDEVPKQAYTMGIKTIMMAKKILVVVSGEDKAETVKNAFFGPVTPQVPASILQMHPDVTIVADEAALSKCDL